MDTGASIPPWSGRRVSDALAFVKAEGRRKKSPCCICEQPIDYSLEYPDPNSCSVQHFKSRKLFPQLTWSRSNWGAAHLSCNKSSGTGEHDDLEAAFVTSEDW